MQLIPEHETEERAHARDRLEHGQGGGIMLFGRGDHGERHVPQSLVRIGNQGEVYLDAFLDRGIGTPLSAPSAIRLVRDLFADLGHVVLAVGLLDMRQELRPFARKMPPAPEEIPGGPHLGGIDVGLREHTPAEEDGNLLRIDRGVFGLAPVHGLHRKRMAKPKGHAVPGAEVGQPLPGEETCDADDQSGPGRRDSCEKRCGASRHVPVHQHLAILVQDAEIPGAGMQIDAAVTLVLLGGESHEVSSSSLVFSLLPAYHGGMWRRGPQ